MEAFGLVDRSWPGFVLVPGSGGAEAPVKVKSGKVSGLGIGLGLLELWSCLLRSWLYRVLERDVAVHPAC